MVNEEALRRWFAGAKRVVVAGIGNPIRMDDFVGVKVVRDLRGRVGENVRLIECEAVPEGFAEEIVNFKPSHVLLIDAAVLGKKPGESVLMEPEELASFPAISTHVLPLRIFCDFIKENTKAKVGLLLIQPEQTDFGEKMSPTVEASAKMIASLLVKVFLL